MAEGSFSIPPSLRLKLVWLSVAVHAAAIPFMLAVLGSALFPADPAARQASVAGASLGFSLGWICWALATVTLVLVFVSWADTLENKAWGALAVSVTLAGALADWLADVTWIALAPDWAARAASDPFFEHVYLLWDRVYQVLALGLANLLYCIGGLTLTILSFRMRHFPRWLAGSSAVVWTVALGLSCAGFAGRAEWIRPVASVAIGLFVPWLILLGYGWLRAAHPPDPSDAFVHGTSFRETLRALVPKHPLAMKTTFRECFLVNFAVDADVMRRLLPKALEPALYDGKAYLSVVIANMDRMRPAFLPRALGVTYNQVVYRAVVRHHGEPGVHFLRSDADHRLMAWAGDWLTFFRFHPARIAYRTEGDLVHFDLDAGRGEHADIHATFDRARAGTELPESSRFATPAEAQAFLVELYAAFGHDAVADRVSTVRIRRGTWNLRIVDDRRARYEFMTESALFPPSSARIDSIFYVEELPYHWHTLDAPDQRAA